MDWFIYDNGFRHERVKETCPILSDNINLVNNR